MNHAVVGKLAVFGPMNQRTGENPELYNDRVIVDVSDVDSDGMVELRVEGVSLLGDKAQTFHLTIPLGEMMKDALDLALEIRKAP